VCHCTHNLAALGTIKCLNPTDTSLFFRRELASGGVCWKDKVAKKYEREAYRGRERGHLRTNGYFAVRSHICYRACTSSFRDGGYSATEPKANADSKQRTTKLASRGRFRPYGEGFVTLRLATGPTEIPIVHYRRRSGSRPVRRSLRNWQTAVRRDQLNYPLS